MLAMAEIDYIRYETNKKDRSYSSVAQQMNKDPRTGMEDFSPQNKLKQVRKAKVMDPVKPIIDDWLAEDMKKK
jgi:hypothetical protein